MMFGGGRQSSEGEVETRYDYVQHTTNTAEKIMSQHGSLDWVSLHKKAKSNIAGKTARAIDGRWSSKFLAVASTHGLGRFQGRPVKRWRDDIVALAGGDWSSKAMDETLWSTLQAGFLAGC